MSDWIINPVEEESVNQFITFFKKVISQGQSFKVSITRQTKRTLSQNNAIHKYCRMLASDLNDAGLTASIESEVLKSPIEVDWTMEMVKEIWHTVQGSMYPEKPVSTAELERAEVSAVYDVINRAMIQKTNGAINTPFPSNES